ncbi:MAG: thioredoxin domain-containing protein [Gemmataceae bacterium]
MTTPRFTNRLARESSPYLRQHAHNPVDWYPWGPEAIARARELDRPIFLSVGYSACHWCHVMEHESFENEEIARILNEHFVSIKVDREERPDVDQIYMASVQMISGQGGWPMTVFLTPDLKPFTGGTYFPPEDRYGRPGFRRILQMLAEAWKNRRTEVDAAANDITQHLQQLGQLASTSTTEPGPQVIREAGRQLERAYDPTHGGFGQAPKFLHTMDLRLLLRIHRRFGDGYALHMAQHTLERMAMGGLYDQLGGGFSRYSTDDRWLVPHFEKMLYDNGLMVTTLSEAYQATGQPYFREIIEETLEWVRREMTAPEGPFYSALDADSEGVEGKFYVWKLEEIEAVLGAEEASLFADCYGVVRDGNWTDPHDPTTPKNILHRTKSYEQLAAMHGIDEEALRHRLNAARTKLLAAREQRVRPGLDDKVLTSWNALMITGLASASVALQRQDYTERASRAADFLLTHMRNSEGKLFRTWSRGGSARLNAYLEDYAYLTEALVALYEATFEPRWLTEALALAETMIDQFWDPASGGFFYTGRDHEVMIARSKDPHDNATPAANSVAVTALLRLFEFTGRTDLLDRAGQTMDLYRDLMEDRPFAAAQMLLALDFRLGPVESVVVVGPPDAEETRRVLRAARNGFQPHRLLALQVPGSSPPKAIALLHDKSTVEGRVTTYVCRNFTCAAPLVGADAVEAQFAS